MPRLTVWTPGRVGSHSVQRHLERVLRGWSTLVLHSACLDEGYLTPKFGTRWRYDPKRPPLKQGRVALDAAEALRTGEGERAIVLVREPVARAVSAWRFFHKAEGSVEHLDHGAWLGWIDRQVKTFAGSNFLKGFDARDGFQVREDRHRVAVIRLEDAERVLPDAVGILTGQTIDPAPLGHEIPSRLGKHPVVSRAFAEYLLEGPYGTSFYTKAERDSAKAFWTSGDRT